MADNQQFEVKPTKSAITAVVAGAVLIFLAFFTYRYFNANNTSEIGSGTNTSDETVEIKDVDEKALPQNGKTSPSGTTSQNTGGTKAQGSAVLGTTVNASWVATDYKSGDIKGASYTVKAGDTLWEIAEARYGSGFEWTKIKDANRSSVGFLPNGSQALIVVGQTLALP